MPSVRSLDKYIITWILFLFRIVVSEQLSWNAQDQTLGASHFEIMYMMRRYICVCWSLFPVLCAKWLHCWDHLRIQPWKITVVLNMLKFNDSRCSAVCRHCQQKCVLMLMKSLSTQKPFVKNNNYISCFMCSLLLHNQFFLNPF